MIKELIQIHNRLIPFGRHNTDMALWPVIFTKRDDMQDNIVNHERIHLRQQVEVTVMALLLLAVLIVLCGWSWWWLAAAPAAFPLLYGLEWLVKWPMTIDSYSQQRSISFEHEAYRNEFDFDYLDGCSWFGWLPYIFDRYE